MKFFKKSYTYAACFGLLLTSSFSYSMLKTFVLSDAIQTVKATTTDTKAAKKAAASATTTDTSYSDDNIQVTLTEKTVENTQVYIADITAVSYTHLVGHRHFILKTKFFDSKVLNDLCSCSQLIAGFHNLYKGETSRMRCV